MDARMDGIYRTCHLESTSTGIFTSSHLHPVPQFQRDTLAMKKPWLVVGWATTPRKNDGVRQLRDDD